MTNDIEQKREAIRAAYSGPKWKETVDKASDAQVVALYIKLKNEGRI